MSLSFLSHLQRKSSTRWSISRQNAGVAGRVAARQHLDMRQHFRPILAAVCNEASKDLQLCVSYARLFQIDRGAGRHFRRGRVDGPEYGRTPVWV